MTPKSKGSVGKNIPTPPNSSSSILRESGVANTINHISLSVATKAINKRTKAKGITANQYCSNAIKALFVIINKKLRISTQFDLISSDILLLLIP